MSELPQLLDCRGIMRETGLTRAMAEKLMRHIDAVKIPDCRKRLVRRDDVLRKLEEWTYTNDRVPS